MDVQYYKPSTEVVQVTDAARNYLRNFLENNETPDGVVRVQLKKSGCTGYMYDMQIAESPQTGDEIVEGEPTICIDSGSVDFMRGTTIDYQQTEQGLGTMGIVYINPNQSAACGCGESVSF